MFLWVSLGTFLTPYMVSAAPAAELHGCCTQPLQGSSQAAGGSAFR